MVQESVFMLLSDVTSLKNPVAQTSHSGWVVVVPTVFVYLPGGHLVWAAHHSKGQSIDHAQGKPTHNTQCNAQYWNLLFVFSDRVGVHLQLITQ